MLRRLPLILLSAAAFAATALADLPSPATLASDLLATAHELLAAGKDAEAREVLTRLVAAAPKTAEAHYQLGLLAARARDNGAAIQHLEKAADLAPDQVDYLLNLAGVYGNKAGTANLFSQLRLAGKIRELIERAVQLAPTNPDARQALVQFYSQAPAVVGGGSAKAHAQADALLALDPARGRIAKAGIYSRDKQYAEAFALWDVARQETPDSYLVLYQIGRLAALSGQRLEQGRDALSRCLTLAPQEGDPSHAAAHWRLGLILEQLGDPTAARVAYQAALQEDPNFAQAKAALKKLG